MVDTKVELSAEQIKRKNQLSKLLSTVEDVITPLIDGKKPESGEVMLLNVFDKENALNESKALDYTQIYEDIVGSLEFVLKDDTKIKQAFDEKGNATAEQGYAGFIDLIESGKSILVENLVEQEKTLNNDINNVIGNKERETLAEPKELILAPEQAKAAKRFELRTKEILGQLKKLKVSDLQKDGFQFVNPLTNKKEKLDDAFKLRGIISEIQTTLEALSDKDIIASNFDKKGNLKNNSSYAKLIKFAESGKDAAVMPKTASPVKETTGTEATVEPEVDVIDTNAYLRELALLDEKIDNSDYVKQLADKNQAKFEALEPKAGFLDDASQVRDNVEYGLTKNKEAFFKTKGGYKIVTTVNKGHDKVTIYNKDDEQITKIWGDPHVNEHGVTEFHFGDDSTFILDDGTEIYVNSAFAKNYSEGAKKHGDTGVQYARGLYIIEDNDLYHVGRDLTDQKNSLEKEFVKYEGEGRRWDGMHSDKGELKGAGVFAWSLEANQGAGGWAYQAENGKWQDVAKESFGTYKKKTSFEDQSDGNVRISRAARIAALDGKQVTHFGFIQQVEGIDDETRKSYEDQYLEYLDGGYDPKIPQEFARLFQLGKDPGQEKVDVFDKFTDSFPIFNKEQNKTFVEYLQDAPTHHYAETYLNFVNNGVPKQNLDILDMMMDNKVELTRTLKESDFETLGKIKDISNQLPRTTGTVNRVIGHIIANRDTFDDSTVDKYLDQIAQDIQEGIVDNPDLTSREKSKAVSKLLARSVQMVKDGDISYTFFDADYRYAELSFKSIYAENADVRETFFDIVDSHEKIILENKDKIANPEEALENINMMKGWKKKYAGYGFDPGQTKLENKDVIGNLTRSEKALYDEFVLLNPDENINSKNTAKLLNLIDDNKDPELIRTFSYLLSEKAADSTLTALDKMLKKNYDSVDAPLSAEFINTVDKFDKVGDKLAKAGLGAIRYSFDNLVDSMLENPSALDSKRNVESLQDSFKTIDAIVKSNASKDSKAFAIKQLVNDLTKIAYTGKNTSSNFLDNIILEGNPYKDNVFERYKLQDNNSERAKLLVLTKSMQVDTFRSQLSFEYSKTDKDSTRIDSLELKISTLENTINELKSII
jgi:hypothetical protein